MKYTDKQIDDLIEDIYKGRVTQTELPEDLYFAIADHLEKGLYKGFGGDLASFGGKDYELLNELRENVYMFSGAKTYQEVREMSNFLADSENFKEFKDKALEVYDTYNKNWLEAEYNTAIGQGMQAQQWNEIEKNKKDFPYLRYSAVIDGRTSDICEPINGVTLPVDDPFWSEYTPLNHFNCRCTLEQIDKFEDVQTTPKEDLDTLIKGTNENKGLKDTVADAFKMNSGKDGYVFSPEHPYFEVAPKDRDLARENFNLPIPEAPAPKEIEFTPAKSIKEARQGLKNLIEKTSNYKINKLSLSSNLNLEQVNERFKSLNILFNDYKINEVADRSKAIDVLFKSEGNTLGVVKSTKRLDDTNYWTRVINFGDKAPSLESTTFDEKFLGQRFNSRVDPKNNPISVTYHEFAHVIADSDTYPIKNCPKYIKDYFTDLRKLREEYSNELLELNKKRDLLGINKISLGRYSSTNIDEFHAEGFTEYKLSSNPSKYAQKIGSLIDKYFKK